MMEIFIKTPEENQQLSKNEVARQMVQFKRERSGYSIWLLVQGYQTHVNGMLFSERLPLGFCKEKQLTETVEIFSKANHDVEIVES